MSESHLTRFLLLPELKLTDFKFKSSERFYQATKESAFEVCPKCATCSSKIHDRRQVRVKHSPEAGKTQWILITKRRFRCPKCKSVFTEPIQGIRKGARVTQKFERSVLWACEMFSDLKKVRTTYRCSYKFIYKCFYRQLELKQREKQNDPWPKTIGIDEHGLFRDKKRGAREFATLFVDHTNKRVKEVVYGKSHANLVDGIGHIEGRDKVQNVTIDLSDSYKSFVLNYFPNAKIVADKFHVIRLLHPALNRRRIGITGDKRTLGIRRLLLKNGFHLDYFTRNSIWKWLEDYPELKEVYTYKEAIHRMYRCRGYTKARRSLIKIIDQMAYSKVEEVQRLRRTLRKWFNEILRYFSTRLTNARTEAFNNHAKLIQRRAYGFKSFKNYRLRLLNACS